MNLARRSLAFVWLVLLAPVALGAEADPAAMRIKAFYDVLLDGMKRAKMLGVRGRYDKFAPAVKATFDLPAMTRIAVGPAWNTLDSEQQKALIEQFTRMTIATYARRFDGYSGERFEVEPAAETRNANRITHTKIVIPNQDPVVLDYLLQQTPDGWQATDVYLTGTISELATRRSEFGAVLKSGGAPALIDSLRQRADKLLGG